MHLSKFASVAFTAIVAAQSTNDLNPQLDISGCSALSCSNDSMAASICNQTDTRNAYGVGMVSNAFNTSDSSLSYTLVDGTPWGSLEYQLGYDWTTLTLYAGAATPSELSNEAPGCALLLQYQDQTFPEYSSSDTPSAHTTQCSDRWGSSCLDAFTELADSFQYTSSDDLPRCQALAQHVQYNLKNTSCLFFAPLMSVTGGAISGPDVDTSLAQIYGSAQDSCSPILPETYQLYEVLSARQILRTELSADTEDVNMGGRAGYSPVVSVLFDGDDNDSASVQVLCMHAYTPSGDTLPAQQRRFDSGADGGSIGWWRMAQALVFPLLAVLA